MNIVQEVTLPSLRAFETFLRWLPSGQVIGQRVTCDKCPLAIWLQTYAGVPVAVDEETILFGTCESDLQTFLTPEDYQDFMFRIDYGGFEERDVTVGEARQALKEVLDEA